MQVGRLLLCIRFQNKNRFVPHRTHHIYSIQLEVHRTLVHLVPSQCVHFPFLRARCSSSVPSSLLLGQTHQLFAFLFTILAAQLRRYLCGVIKDDLDWISTEPPSTRFFPYLFLPFYKFCTSFIPISINPSYRDYNIVLSTHTRFDCRFHFHLAEI